LLLLFPQSDIKDDFRALRAHCERAGWFKPNAWFYGMHLAHIVALEAAAFGLLYWFGTGPFVTLLAMLILATEQVKAIVQFV